MEMNLDQLEEAITTTRVVFTDSYSERERSHTPSPSRFCFYPPDSAASPPRDDSAVVMNDRDKAIYNSLGSSSSPRGKLTFTELGLGDGDQKRGIMAKTRPCPSWYTPWKQRVFILKENFLYYFSVHHKLNDSPVLGAIYLKNAVIEKVAVHFAKFVLRITPTVPRRRGWEENDDTCVFHIKFRTKAGRDEWFEELQQVSFSHMYPTMKGPTIDKSMDYTQTYLYTH